MKLCIHLLLTRVYVLALYEAIEAGFLLIAAIKGTGYTHPALQFWGVNNLHPPDGNNDKGV